MQSDHFKYLGGRKTGRIWVTALIKKLWQVSWDQWDCRSWVLHNIPVVADLGGDVSLDTAIMVECELGSDGLPEKVRGTLPSDTSTLLTSTLVERK